MKTILEVLIIEDHPVIIDIYKKTIIEINGFKNYKNFSFHFTEASNCDDALEKIDKATLVGKLDLILLDINLPASINNKVISGEDIGVIVKKLFPNVKLIIFTSTNENARLSSILYNLNPEAFLIKSDVSYNEIIKAICSVLDNTPYYSKTILKLLHKQISTRIVIDKIDRQLLYEISRGTKMKDLPNILPMSMAGIERRKRVLKNLFNIPYEEDKRLIEIARENGFL